MKEISTARSPALSIILINELVTHSSVVILGADDVSYQLVNMTRVNSTGGVPSCVILTKHVASNCGRSCDRFNLHLFGQSESVRYLQDLKALWDSNI